MSDSQLCPSACTLVDLLRYRTVHQSGEIAFTFLEDGETEAASLTYSGLDRCSRAIASQLQALGLQGERALLLYQPGLDYLAAFFGCLYAGVVAVPAYPPRNQRNTPRIQAIVADSQAAIALSTTTIQPRIQSLLAEAHLKWLTTDNLASGIEENWQPPAINPHSLAFLQYTSGSTGTPKGVMLTHGNLLHNAATTYECMGHSPSSKFVSWLPTYHDMGLIGGILQPLYGGFPCILMPPAAFLQRPYRWLQAISRYGGTTSGAPNFAYELCVDKITEAQKQTLDLSSWDVAFNGAEPIRQETLERFAAAFASCGFRQTAFYPCYGLAEASLMVTGSCKAEVPKVSRIDAAALEHNQAIATTTSDHTLVSSGQSIPDQEIIIVNPETLTCCQPDEVGEIWVSGPSIGQGYWNRETETQATFQAYTADTQAGPFLRTGDLGFLHAGELFVTGRAKDIIIVRGRNLYPQDIELIAETSHPSLRVGSVAAFAVEVGNEEQLVVVQEVEFRQKPDVAEVAAAMRQAIAETFEIQVYAVVLIKAGTIPKTSSGKIQRRATRADYLTGKLEVLGSSVLETAGIGSERILNRESLLAIAPAERQTLLESYLQQLVGEIFHFHPELQQPLSAAGIDSLKVFELKNKIELDFGVNLSVAELFGEVNVAQLATLILAAITAGTAVSRIQPTDRDRIPLSFSQERLWFLDQLEPGNPFYNLAATVRLTGKLNVEALTHSIQQILHRHKSLRTRFISQDGQPLQVIAPETDFNLSVIDLSEFSESAQAAEVEHLCNKEARSPFDLQQGNLFRAQLLRLTATKHILLLTVHHIVFDGWSMRLLLQELATLYQAFVSNTAPSLPELPIQYADFAVWQRQALASTELTYWQQQLSGNLPILDLPTDFPRPAVQTFQGKKYPLVISKSLTAKLRELSQQKGVTLFMLLMAGFNTLLYRYTGQEDILVGSPIANRNRSEVENLIGFFANTLVFRTQLSENPSFAALLSQVRETAIAAYQHQNIPFEKLVEVLQPERDLSRNPLFQVLFALHNFAQPTLEVSDLTLSLQERDTGTARFDLALDLWEEPELIRGTWEYNQDLFTAATITRIGEQFQTLLESIVATPDAPISTLSLLTPAEQQQLLVEWNASPSTYQATQCIHQQFVAQVEKFPDAIAVVCEDKTLTYQQLNHRANQLAHYLQKLGVKPEVRVGIFVERSLEMIVGLLGILKAGGAYVPLDPTYTNERLQFMLADAEVVILLTQTHLTEVINSSEIFQVCLDGDWERIAQESTANPITEVTPENLAYVIYTSGSTGKPKGVEIAHGSVVHLFAATRPMFNFDERDVWTVFHSYAFDFSVWEIWGALLHASKLVVVPRYLTQSPGEFYDLLVKEQVTILSQTPSALRQLLTVKTASLNLRLIVCGGEALPSALATQLMAWNVSLYNFYGPTEATVWATIHAVESIDGSKGAIPIGKAIADKQIYILDNHLQPVPIGVPGEIHIGGMGLARGYLNRPELTAEKFIDNPFNASERLYKTGDLGRYLPDGTIEFINRLDYQVKIRGFRIELGEIEAVLNQHPAVQQTVVIAREDQAGDQRLVAYLVMHSQADLREFLKQQLPEYMIPSAFVLLEALPLTANGKIDRKVLPAPEFSGAESFVAPRTPAEKQLAEIWSQVLGVESVGIHDNFFELGGHSLLATQIIAKVREAFGVALPLRTLFQSPTVASLLEQLQDQDALTLLPTITPERDRRHQPFPLTDIQQAYWIGRGAAFELGNIAAHIYLEIDAVDLDLDRFNQAWQRLIERHEMLRTVILTDGQQQILSQVPRYKIKRLDLQAETAAGVTAQLKSIRDRLSHQISPSDKFPLFEICASQLDNRRTRLHFSFDLLIADAWSFQIIGQELAALYQNPETILEPLHLSFRDYVLAEMHQRNSPQYQRSQAYWHNRIPTLPPPPELPLAQNPSAIQNPEFVRRSGHLPAETWQSLKQFASKAGITPSVLLLTAFAEVLSVWSKTPRFTLTLTLFNRLPLHPQVNELVGDFTSINLLAVDHATTDTFSDRARRLQAQLWEDLDHREVSGVQVLRELAKNQGRLSSALIPVVFTSTLTQDALGESKFPLDWLGEMTYGITQTPQVFLDHQVAEAAGALIFNWDAIEELFPAGLLDEMFAAYCTFLERLAADAATWQATLPQLVPPTHLQQQAAINATDAPVSSHLLHTLFTEQVPLQAEKAAVVTTQRTLTYAELHRRSRQLGSYLQQLGAHPNQLIAVVMEKGWEQVVAVLGILYAGAAYVPIDPQLPPERRSHLFAQAEIQLVVTQSWLDQTLEWSDGIQRICVDTAELADNLPLLEPLQTPDDIAYVIYTSGSTGLPKGVTIDHRGAVNTILDINQRFNVQASDRVLALSALNFDLSVYDIFGTLAAGGTIVMPDAKATQEPAHWAALMQREQITLWNSVPALMQMMVDYGVGNPQIFSHLRLVLLSGDWLPLTLPAQIKTLNPHTQIISLGGATEASIWSILYPIESVNPDWKSIPYGKPMQNQRFYVLNQALVPCPVWVPGQLYIGGIGLAKGYWRDETKTAASFITHPQTGERLYRTGDLGRYLPDGNIEFLGREDFQVKIGGYRIELGEIEATLLKHPAVREAVVNAVGETTHKRLVAYVIPNDSDEEFWRNPQWVEALRRCLSEKLPSYMVPATFMMLDSLPLTANGKVNRKALPIPKAVKKLDESAIAPHNPTEALLMQLWCQILNVEQVSIYDNFFDLGGDSLRVTQLIAKVRETLQVELPLRDFFTQPTIAGFAECIEKAKSSKFQVEESEIVPISRKAHRMKLSSLKGD